MTRSDAVAARILALDPRANSWLRHSLELEGARFVEADGGVLVITAGQAKLADPTSDAAAARLARASEALADRIDFVSGPERAVAEFVRARADASRWARLHLSTEMAHSTPTAPEPARGALQQVGALVASRPDDPLPAPFGTWMRDFASSFAPGDGPPPVRPHELWTWVAEGAPRAMAGALRRGVDGARLVTVYTPPSERGRGYAGALVAALTAQVRASGAAHVTLDVLADNEAARRAYLRVGFRAVASTARWRRA